jgi:hypothetical protein
MSTTATRKPAKPWRVYGARGLSTDHRSQRAAYEAVKAITTGVGACAAKVYHWEAGTAVGSDRGNGSWRYYERIDPPETTTNEGQEQ